MTDQPQAQREMTLAEWMATLVSVHRAQDEYRWLLKCEKAIKNMAGQICSPKTTPEQFVADCLGEKAPGKRASR